MSSFAIGLLTADRDAKVSTEERRDNRRHPTSVTYPPEAAPVPDPAETIRSGEKDLAPWHEIFSGNVCDLAKRRDQN